MKPEFRLLSAKAIATLSGYVNEEANDDFFKLHGTGFIGDKTLKKHFISKQQVKNIIETSALNSKDKEYMLWRLGL